jgi:N-acetylglucosaminyldiphosphoundecaprenol N-acetyl-beta-D-mannosaminyltransferase
VFTTRGDWSRVTSKGECLFQEAGKATHEELRMSEPNAQRREFCVEGIAINLKSPRQAIAAIIGAARQTQGFCAFTLNLDHCAKLRSHRTFRRAYRRAQFVTADGFPIVMLGRLAGVRLRRTTGADLAAPLCAEAARHNLPIVLFGPNSKTLHRAQARLHRHIRGLRIVDAFAPGPNFDPNSSEADLAIERIRQSGARLCFIAVGAPRQEIFAARCLDRCPGIGLVCVGAAFDFIAGTQKRAPRAFQQVGLEWLWRLSSDPQRFAARYMRSAAMLPRLVVDVIPQAISTRLGRPS